MPKSAGGRAEKLSALIAGIEADAYARGRADAKKELLDLLQPGDGRTGASAARGKRTSRRQRAPRGSVRPFVERVLRERQGATVPEILGHAASDAERSIKLSSIRVELRNGRLRGQYVSDGGRWSLAVSEASSAAPEETTSSEPPPGSAPDEDGAGSGAPETAGEAAAPEGGKGVSGTTLGLKF